MVIGMEVPFNIIKYEEEKLYSDLERFQELLKKYGNCTNEVLEFARLYNRLVSHMEQKYVD